jgi:S-layer protein (TIGR01567 family)
MFPHIRLVLLIAILIAPVACKEVAYVYGESGGHVLQDMNLTAHNGSETVAYAVSLGEGSGPSLNRIKNTSTEKIKYDISKKVNQLNREVIKEGSKLIGNISGDKRIDQICSIYEYLVSNWVYKADWKGLDYYQYSNESLEYGQDVGKGGKGDCDDFSILLAALIESVGGTPRIVFAYGPQGGHAYCQVYIGQDNGYDSKVSRMIEWLKSEYGVKEVYLIKDDVTEDAWLNLDWWKDPKASKDVKHPGGPLFNASDFVLAYSDNESEKWTSLTPVPEPPLARFSISKANPNALENVTFDASESKDADTEITAWKWDFDDGEKGKGRSVVHSFAHGGRYNVTLTVTDDDDVEKSSQSTQMIEVNGRPIPVIDYEPKEPKLGEFVDFDASLSNDPDPGGSIKKYEWDFGDGVMLFSEDPDPHKYKTNGSYTVSLKVEDDKGATNTTSIIIKVNLPPEAVMSIEPPTAPNQFHNIGDEVKFSAYGSRDRDGRIKNWNWDFGDGANASGVQVSHIYSAWDEFPVILNVTDDNNASHKIEMPLKINARPIANFTFDPLNPELGFKIDFNASSSMDPDGRIDEYIWDFVEERKSRSVPYVDYTYERKGEYNVTLTVRDNSSATNTTTKIVTIYPPDTKNFMQEGQSLINANKYEDAIDKFDSVLLQEPLNEMALFYKGFCLNKLGKYENALSSLNASLEANPKNIYAWNEKTNAYAGLGRYEEALYSSNKSIELNPNNWFVWNDRGLLLYKTNEFEKASDAYDKALSLNPSESDKKDILVLKENALSQIPKSSEQLEIAVVEPGAFEIRGSVATADFTWNPRNFAGFYYDINNDLGTETLSTTLTDNKLSGDEPYGVKYVTTAQSKEFKFEDWGAFKVMGFLADEYFAGYVENVDNADKNILFKESIDENSLSRGQLQKILIDDDTEKTVTSGTPMKLEEGYELAIKSIDIDGNKVYIELTKDGSLIDSKVISPSKDGATMADKTYYYMNPQVGDQKKLITIAAHFKNAFRGADQNMATVDGLWQISGEATEVKADTQYDKMTITSVDVGAKTITMENKDNAITLSKNKDTVLMGGLKIKTADNSTLRYYIYKEITEPGTYIIRGEIATDSFGWDPQNFAGFYYDINDDIGTETLITTLSDGKLSGNSPYGVEYVTTSQSKEFKFEDWGAFKVMGFMADKYFAGYVENIDNADKNILFKESTDENSLSKGQLQKILINDDTDRTVTSGTPLRLEEGYVLAIKSIDIDGNNVNLELSKDGAVVDSKVISPSRDGASMVDKTYYYNNPVVGDQQKLITIAAHFKNAFRGADHNLATVDGLWQISGEATDVKADTQYDKMTITTIDANAGTITMVNKDDAVTLSKNTDTTLMSSIRIKTANTDPLIYYIYKEVTIEGDASEAEAAPVLDPASS